MDPLEIEQKKLEIELEKLSIERSKIIWTAGSVVVPLMAAVGTLFFGIWSAREQAESNFQLEAAKAVMKEAGPQEALNRMRFLAAVFPDKLPAHFYQPVSPEQFRTIGDPSASMKLEFVKLLSSKGLSAGQTAELWRAVFQENQWITTPEVLKLLEKGSTTVDSKRPPGR